MTSASEELAILKKYLRYEPDTGNFYWIKANNNKKKPGDVAGSIMVNGYRQIGLKNKRYTAHRLAFLFSYGRWPKITDHINRVRTDNRIVNLREVNHTESNINKRPHKKAKSGYRGVTIRSGSLVRPYRATAKWDGKQIAVGYFATALEAHLAYVSFYKSKGIEVGNV